MTHKHDFLSWGGIPRTVTVVIIAAGNTGREGHAVPATAVMTQEIGQDQNLKSQGNPNIVIDQDLGADLAPTDVGPDHLVHTHEGGGHVQGHIQGEVVDQGLLNFSVHPPSKQAELRLQLALKAAAAADQKLHERGLLADSSRSTPISFEDQQKRMQDLESIEHESFEPAVFKSSASKPLASTKSVDTLHSDAIFSTSGPVILPAASSVGQSVLSDVRQLFGSLFYVPQEEKQKIWMKKLREMRSRKLERDAM
ncbi:hypothetical protein CAPTEDRAFT_213808 [Capitella teleta]|uniref:Uncharacterized protein n=1 Tax=Capitella teleta TaxID=283909 RepID=R7UEQ1_CAPTE|nr:hypothetical protein CAPTEDRAFT_213808 [Capitella teleta]|eukprot:ELU02268.1 hypothetical protein CAPTEDRAFT_213808 [Capitella teleta]